MTLEECKAWMRPRGFWYADQPVTVSQAVYDARQAREDGMLRAIRAVEVIATSVSVGPPEGVEWEVET